MEGGDVSDVQVEGAKSCDLVRVVEPGSPSFCNAVLSTSRGPQSSCAPKLG